MGLAYPQTVQDTVPAIASFLDSPEPLLRERAVNALGRIGRGSYPVIEPYWMDLFAGEMIQTTDPEYKKVLDVITKTMGLATELKTYCAMWRR